MNQKEEILRKLRALQTILSVSLFFVISFFFIITTELKLKDIQISQWGTLDNTGWIFNYSLMVLSISIFLNSIFYIKNNNRIIYKNLLYFLFGLISIFLFFTGYFSVDDNRVLHNIFAFSYFFAYPLVLFIFSYLNRKSILYKNWLFHLITSISMIIIPTFLISFFNGMAIPEIVHTLIVMIWNIKLLIKN